jgi:hypothetical protein
MIEYLYISIHKPKEQSPIYAALCCLICWACSTPKGGSNASLPACHTSLACFPLSERIKRSPLGNEDGWHEYISDSNQQRKKFNSALNFFQKIKECDGSGFDRVEVFEPVRCGSGTGSDHFYTKNYSLKLYTFQIILSLMHTS